MESSRSSFRKAEAFAVAAALPAALLAAWELASRGGLANPVFFPPPSAVLGRLVELLRADEAFARDVWRSHLRLFWGALVSAPPAVAAGLALGLSPRTERWFRSLVALSYPVPKLALYPLIMVLLGIGEASKVAIIAVGVFFLVFFSTLHGCQRLFQADYMDIAAVFGVPHRTRFFSIGFLGALPEILSGLKIGLGFGLWMVVASEFTFSQDGVGFFMWRAWDQFRVLDIYCGLAVLSASGMAIFFALDRCVKRLRWYRPGQGPAG